VAASSIPATKALATPDESKQLATLIDISKCIGCEACVEACSEVNSEKYPDPKKTVSENVSQSGTGRRLV
jgi:Fe-S-cluster-containing dehydrogenase component